MLPREEDSALVWVPGAKVALSCLFLQTEPGSLWLSPLLAFEKEPHCLLSWECQAAETKGHLVLGSCVSQCFVLNMCACVCVSCGFYFSGDLWLL